MPRINIDSATLATYLQSLGVPFRADYPGSFWGETRVHASHRHAVILDLVSKGVLHPRALVLSVAASLCAIGVEANVPAMLAEVLSYGVESESLPGDWSLDTYGVATVRSYRAMGEDHRPGSTPIAALRDFCDRVGGFTLAQMVRLHSIPSRERHSPASQEKRHRVRLTGWVSSDEILLAIARRPL